jgi:hypothetical protein
VAVVEDAILIAQMVRSFEFVELTSAGPGYPESGEAVSLLVAIWSLGHSLRY